MFGYIYKFLDKVKSKLSEKGQGMVEYALIIAFVAGVAFVALGTSDGDTGLAKAIKEAFSSAEKQINDHNPDKTNSSGGGGESTDS